VIKSSKRSGEADLVLSSDSGFGSLSS